MTVVLVSLSVVKLICLDWNPENIELSLTCSRATAQQTLRWQPHVDKWAFLILHFTFVPSIPYSLVRPKPPTPTFPLPPQTHGKVNGVYCTFAPLPSLWGRTHFDRPVFMANWSHVGMNHETDQSSGWMSISTDRWSAVRLVVCGPYRENRTCLYEFSYVWEVSDKLLNEQKPCLCFIFIFIFVIFLCLFCLMCHFCS